MNDEDTNERFTKLIQQWEPKARAWLILLRVNQSDRDEIIQSTYLAFLAHVARNPWPKNQWGYLWGILANERPHYFKRYTKAGRPTPQLPEMPCSPADERLDAILDFRFFLNRYAEAHPVVAGALHAWLDDCNNQPGDAARNLDEQADGKRAGPKRIVRIPRRISAYWTRFGAWLKQEFPDYVA